MSKVDTDHTQVQPEDRLDAWLKQQANRLDPTPLGVHMTRMLANGYDGSGLDNLGKSPAEVLAFINHHDLYPWSEGELTMGQRRLWARIRYAYRQFLTDRSRAAQHSD